MSQVALEKVLDAIRMIKSLPEAFRESLPSTYQGLLFFLKDKFDIQFSMEFVYDVCQKCLTVYRCGSKDARICRRCGSPRYGSDGENLCVKFVYRSFSETMKRWFANKRLAELATYHAGKRSEHGDVCDFQDGVAYQRAMEDPAFSNDSRHILVGLASDGVQPFEEDKKFSIWPLLATSYNFPPSIRYLLGVTTLLGVIPGSREEKASKDPSFSLQSYLQIFVDELAFLHRFGVLVYDAFRHERFRCKAKLVQVSLTITSVCTPYRFAKCMDELAFILQVMADMRGLDKFFEQTFAGSTFGCIYCWLRGYQRANKMVYSGHHVYLPPCHHLRPRIARHNQASEMPERAADSTLQPSPRTNEELRNGMLLGRLPWRPNMYLCWS